MSVPPSLPDVDLNIEECLQNCPDLDVPLLDASILDQLCLPDDLWAKLDVADPQTGDVFYPEDELEHCQPLSAVEYLGLSTPPHSPPDFNPSQMPPSISSTVTGAKQSSPPHMPPASSSESTQTVTNSRQEVQCLGDGVVWPSCTPSSLPRSGSSEALSFASISASSPTVSAGAAEDTSVQVLKSGEVVRLTFSQPGPTSDSQSVAPFMKSESSSIGRKRPLSSSSPPESSLSRKQQRMIKNRESANISRLKKKEHMQTMEVRLREAALKNAALLKENTMLRKQVAVLEHENISLRSGFSQPSTPLSYAVGKPAVVMVVALLFVSSLFLFPRYMSPFTSQRPVSTALTAPVYSHGRALLSFQSSEQETAIASQERSLVPMSSALAVSGRSVKEGPAARRKHGRFIAGTQNPPDSLANVYSTMCSCPAKEGHEGNGTDVRNVTTMKRLSGDISQCFKWHEGLFQQKLQIHRQPKVLQMQTSLAILDADLSTIYPHFKKSFTRDLYNYYLISFKDHILLDAPLHNSSEPPLLSLIIPSDAPSLPGYMPLLQIDCEVLNTKVLHVEVPQSAV